MDTPEPFDQTILRMHMVDLFPQEQVEQLRRQFGRTFDGLHNIDQVALVIAAVEGTVTHQRLCALANAHPADASHSLRNLVGHGFLEQTGSSRGAVYHISGTQIPGPEDVFDSPNLETSSPNLDSSSLNLDSSSPNLERDVVGRLISDSHAHPFVENLQQLSPDYYKQLINMAKEPRNKKKVPRAVMQETLLKLLEDQFVTLSCLAELVRRDPETLRGQYLNEMVKKQKVEIAFPRTPNHPRQAYRKAKA